MLYVVVASASASRSSADLPMPASPSTTTSPPDRRSCTASSASRTFIRSRSRTVAVSLVVPRRAPRRKRLVDGQRLVAALDRDRIERVEVELRAALVVGAVGSSTSRHADEFVPCSSAAVGRMFTVVPQKVYSPRSNVADRRPLRTTHPS